MKIAIYAAPEDRDLMRKGFKPFIDKQRDEHPVWTSWDIVPGAVWEKVTINAVVNSNLIIVGWTSNLLSYDYFYKTLWSIIRTKDPDSVLLVYLRAVELPDGDFQRAPEENPVMSGRSNSNEAWMEVRMKAGMMLNVLKKQGEKDMTGNLRDEMLKRGQMNAATEQLQSEVLSETAFEKEVTKAIAIASRKLLKASDKNVFFTEVMELSGFSDLAPWITEKAGQSRAFELFKYEVEAKRQPLWELLGSKPRRVLDYLREQIGPDLKYEVRFSSYYDQDRFNPNASLWAGF